MFNTMFIDIHAQYNEDIHHLIQENRKLQHEVASLNARLQDLQHTHNRLREYVNDKLATHHSYHPTDLPWFWQGLNAQDAHFIE